MKEPREVGSLQPGARVRLSGGYDTEPRWLGGTANHVGTVQRFMPGQNDLPAAVVVLDQQITVDDVTGRLLVLELRHQGAEWRDGAVVHIELCDFDPEATAWKDRKRGKWVEAAATLQII